MRPIRSVAKILVNSVSSVEEDKCEDDVYERSHTNVEGNISTQKMYINEFFKRKYINNNKLQKIDKIVKKGDVVEVLDCYGWKDTNLLKC